jgi:hypothetical protein
MVSSQKLAAKIDRLKKTQKTVDTKETDLEKQQQNTDNYNKDVTDAINTYLELTDRFEQIHETRCSNLNDYVYNLVKYFHAQIKEILAKYKFLSNSTRFKHLEFGFNNKIRVQIRFG